MAKLILMNNGQTSAEARGIWGGTLDSELTAQGRIDAFETALRLAPIAINEVYISEQRQTRLTAERILEKQVVKSEPVPTRALNERDFGILTGKHERDLQASLGKRETELARRQWNYVIPDGETLRHVYEHRIVPFHTKVVERLLLEEIEAPDPTVLVVSHQHPLRAYVRLLEDLSEHAVHGLEFGSAEIRAYRIALNGGATPVVLP